MGLEVRMKIFSLLLPLALAACTTTDYMRDAKPSPAPGPDQAKVVVYRTATFGGADNYPVYDDAGNLLGFTETDCYFEILRPPGRYRFAALGEGESVVDAELAGGRTYYLRASSKFGIVTSRPVLAPVGRDSEHAAEIDQVLPRLQARELDPASGPEYEARKERRAKEAFAGDAKPRFLRPDDGREEPATLPAK
jgi:hypothetical protein